MPTGVLRSSVTRPCRSNWLPTTTPCRSTRASCPASRTRTTLFTRSVYFCVWRSVWVVEWINVLMLPWEDTRCMSVMLCSQNCFVPQLGNTQRAFQNWGVCLHVIFYFEKEKSLCCSCVWHLLYSMTWLLSKIDLPHIFSHVVQKAAFGMLRKCTAVQLLNAQTKESSFKQLGHKILMCCEQIIFRSRSWNFRASVQDLAV